MRKVGSYGETAKCVVCGKEFERKGRQIYCSRECSRVKINERARLFSREAEQRKKEECIRKRNIKKSKANVINEIAKAAREAGMSYGQYVAMQETGKEKRNEHD